MLKEVPSSYREKALEEIRETIKDYRSQGISQASLAKELGITREYLNRMLNNDKKFNDDVLLYLCVRLGYIKAR